jgi:hypothetical protein
MHGRIATDWKYSPKEFRLALHIPVNTTATVYVPAPGPDSVKEGRQRAAAADGVECLRQEGGAAVFRVGSGKYSFAASQ